VAHFISDDRLIRLAHRLLCALLAAYDFPDLYRDRGDYPNHDPDPFDDLRALEDSDFSEHLVMLCGLARVNDDIHQTLAAVDKVLPEGVGTLEENGTTKRLSPRDACNKIIHAKTISYELDWCEEHPVWNRFYERQRVEVRGSFKNPKITITGITQSEREWKAKVNAINFLLSVSTDYWKWNLA
jgi:hypothetical protein